MSFVAFSTILGGLGIVLILLGLAFAAIRRLTGVSASARARVPLEVVQRLALGPKQGIAVVRIGERVVAVSMGDGGVRPLIEVAESDREAILSAAATGTSEPLTGGVLERLRLPAGRDFSAALRTAMGVNTTLVLLLAAALLAPAIASAQVASDPNAVRPISPSAEFIAQADTMISRLAPEMELRLGDRDSGGLRLSGTVGIVVMMGLLTLLPTLLLMMTSFTRILVVLHFLRQALGTQSAPPAHLMAALALLLSGFVMAPTLSEVNRTALQPWMNGEIEQGEMLAVGSEPFREFMLAQTRDRDLATFMEMRDDVAVTSTSEIPLVVVISAFVTSELRTAFQIGFALFLPFIVIDVVVAAVLMSMGMFMLPPAMISLPFKLLLFVLVDGWSLIVQGLVSSFS